MGVKKLEIESSPWWPLKGQKAQFNIQEISPKNEKKKKKIQNKSTLVFALSMVKH